MCSDSLEVSPPGTTINAELAEPAEKPVLFCEFCGFCVECRAVWPRRLVGHALPFEGLAQQGNRSWRLGREIPGRGLDADAIAVADLAEVREERRVIVFVPRPREDTSLRIGHVQMAKVLADSQHDCRVFAFTGQM